MSLILISFAIIIFACIILDKVSNRLGVPALFFFLVLGLFVGWAQNVDREHFKLVESICNIALMFIIFYGGFGVRWKSAKPIIAESTLLASVGVILTILITGLCSHYILEFDWLESMLIAAILGSTDAASVFSILRRSKLGLKNNIAPMIEMESGSNDPFAYILTAIILSLYSGSVDGTEISLMLLKQVFFGFTIGCIVAKVAKIVLDKYPVDSSGMCSLYIMAIALVGYAVPGLVGGNGFLSVYIVGIYLGNKVHFKDKKELVHFFDGVVNLIQMLLFFMLGLLAKPETISSAIIPAIGILLIMVVISRPIAVNAILLPFRSKMNKRKSKYSIGQRTFVSFVGLRGAASIVFVVMALAQYEELADDIYNVIFCVVIFSICLQGTFITYVAKKLNVVDDSVDVMTTFSDFSDVSDMQFGKILISSNSSWCGKKISDIDLPKNLVLVLVLRGTEKILPKSRVLLLEGDTVILGLKSWNLEDGIALREHRIDPDSGLDGKLVKDIPSHHNNVILMIQRGNEEIIPTGKTIVKNDDILVIIETQAGIKRFKTSLG